ncbi:MAG: hypothetical protein Q4B22_09385, partial [Eubacteriales bacterium]|nr:hypothetical protein [Eubacteriales bacterium]
MQGGYQRATKENNITNTAAEAANKTTAKKAAAKAPAKSAAAKAADALTKLEAKAAPAAETA